MGKELKMKEERESLLKRSPLQRLNGLQIRKPNTKKTLNITSSNSSSASSSSSSSRPDLHIRPKHLSIPTNNAPLKSSAVALKPRSKENEFPKKPIKNQPPRLNKKQDSKSNTKPTIKNCPRSKLCSSQRNPQGNSLKGSKKLEGKKSNNCEGNGSGELPIKLFEVSSNTNLDCVESSTPRGKTKASVCGFLDPASFDYTLEEGSISKTDSDTSVKTPPVEASLSPDIQFGSHSKVAVIKPTAATPVCYGAGVHLLSGVTDKRKCRRRGSLKGGFEKFNLYDDDDEDDGNVIGDSQDFLIPLPAEASVHWLLSPCDEEREDSESRLRNVIGGESASVELDMSPSPSMLCGNVLNLGCENSNKKMVEHLLVPTPNFAPRSNGVGSREGNKVRQNVIEYSSAFSLGSLSSGNIIQTPSSDSGSNGGLRVSNVDFVQFELDSITKTLNRVDLSPSREMSLWDVPHNTVLQCADMESAFQISLDQLQENVDGVCSYVSDSTISENLALSQTRISWRDGLVSRIDENEELDCCRCLSDEENIESDRKLSTSYQSGGDEENDLAMNSCLRSHLGTRSGANDDNDQLMYSDVCAPCISARGKEKLSPHRLNASAESICTNGGELVASGDSDWLYFRESHLF